jgi:hypothetical protein
MQDTELMKMEAQQTLDELSVEGLLPFRLFARKVESLGMEEYIVRFYDRRLSSLDLSLRRDEIFKAVFRAAVLDRVARLEPNIDMSKTA